MGTGARSNCTGAEGARLGRARGRERARALGGRSRGGALGGRSRGGALGGRSGACALGGRSRAGALAGRSGACALGGRSRGGALGGRSGVASARARALRSRQQTTIVQPTPVAPVSAQSFAIACCSTPAVSRPLPEATASNRSCPSLPSCRRSVAQLCRSSASASTTPPVASPPPPPLAPPPMPRMEDDQTPST
eukprot:4844923-Prymnesium_polylepis.1